MLVGYFYCGGFGIHLDRGFHASHHLASIIRTTFGIYVSADTDPQVRKNISVIAPVIWANCVDDPKYKIGITLEGYNTNLHKDKYELGEQFLQVVGGNPYRTPNERTIIVDTLLDQLLEKHSGWDNFHHEAPVADLIAHMFKNKTIYCQTMLRNW